ncbi:MAG: DNA methylase N-4 [Dehalococcoidia bacterium]|nr:DNA methylase N-4 [Dehalococcoidia bacterium]
MGEKDEDPNRIKGELRPGAGHNLLLPERLYDRVEYVPPDTLRGYRRQVRKHSKKQIGRICDSITEFGFTVPILVDAEGTVIAGEARLLAARKLGYAEVPVLRARHLSDVQVKAFRVADNKLAALAEWDQPALAEELKDLLEVEFNVELTGFEIPEIQMTIAGQEGPVGLSPADNLPANDDAPPVTVAGDLWLLDEHRLFCGDARDPEAYEAVLNEERAQMVISDLPYNIRIDGNATGAGTIHHREFPMASGEMSPAEFAAFLDATLRQMVRFSENGSVHYLFMNWRRLPVLQAACDRHYSMQLNLCVWVKTNGGMGSLYRSQHELIVVYRNGEAAHINNVRLGKYGRNRTNIWCYEGVNTLNPERRADLALHPTVKPVALVADAMLDCSKPRGLVLDSFLGSGTTIIAAEQTGRRCSGIELDPLYVDVAIRRWEQFTGSTARHARTGLSFAETGFMRHSPVPLLPAPQTEA